MIVDDDPDVRFVVASLLSDDFDTCEAHDGLDALEKVERHHPDMIILDINMPVMNGIACCRAIRRQKSFRDLPVLFLSATGDPNVKRQALESGGFSYIEKPFNPDQISRVVLEYFSRYPESLGSQARDENELDSDNLASPSPVRNGMNGNYGAHKLETATPNTGLKNHKHRLLAIIDTPEMLASFTEAVSDGFEFLPIGDPVLAIEWIARFEPEIVVLSIRERRYTGLQIARMIRGNERLSGIKILFIDGPHCSPRDLAAASQLSKYPFLNLPLSSEGIREALQKAESEEGSPIRKRQEYSRIVEELMQYRDVESTLGAGVDYLARYMARIGNG